jgi:hypothetical protein
VTNLTEERNIKKWPFAGAQGKRVARTEKAEKERGSEGNETELVVYLNEKNGPEGNDTE